MSLTRALDAGIRLPTSMPAVIEGARARINSVDLLRGAVMVALSSSRSIRCAAGLRRSSSAGATGGGATSRPSRRRGGGCRALRRPVPIAQPL